MTLTTQEAQEACQIASDKWAARCARAEAECARLLLLIDEHREWIAKLPEIRITFGTTEEVAPASVVHYKVNGIMDHLVEQATAPQW